MLRSHERSGLRPTLRGPLCTVAVAVVLLVGGYQAWADGALRQSRFSAAGRESSDAIDVLYPAIEVPGSFVLARPNVEPASIVVSVKSPLPPFELFLLGVNVHYLLSATPDAVEIDIVALPAQFLLPGSYDFVVSYSLQTACPGDCDGDGSVTIDELVLQVTVALDRAPVAQCPAGDGNQDGAITVDEIVAAVNAALNGCTLPSPEQRCLASGGSVASALCCASAGDFPDTCGVGACGCGPGASAEVHVCNCGAGSCFDGNQCVSR